MRNTATLALVIALAALPLACGDDDDDVATGGKGGTSGATSGGKGGTTSTGGAATGGKGGTTSTGGATTGGKGGTTSTGGAATGGKGGTTSTGGTVNQGGESGSAGEAGASGGSAGEGGSGGGGGAGGASGGEGGMNGGGGAGGGTSDLTPCEQACAAAAKRMCANQAACEENTCTQLEAFVPDCPDERNAYLECLGRSPASDWTCPDDTPLYSSEECNGYLEAAILCQSMK